MQTTTAVATIVIAVIVAWISLQQWIVNREKFRLDLYDRRFRIYMAVLEHFRSMGRLDRGQRTEVDRNNYDTFLKAVMEARFLFPKESGILGMLEDFRDRTDALFADNRVRRQGFPSAMDSTKTNEADGARSPNLQWVIDSMPRFEDLIAPYLNFHGYKEQKHWYQFRR